MSAGGFSTPDFAVLLAAMAAASFLCRAAGYFAMRFVPMTARLEAALRATPIAVMAGIISIALVRGGPGEWLATIAVLIAMRLTGQDVLAALIGIAVLALWRMSGF